MLEALRAGDYPAAMKVWEQIRRFEELRARQRQSANNVTVVKEALASLGLCRRDVRPPSRALPEAERAEVAAHSRRVVDMSRRPRRSSPEELRSHQWYGTRRAALLQPPRPHPPARLPPRGAPGQAGHRDPQHLVRHQPLPCPPARARAGGQARACGRRAASRSSSRSPRSRETFQKPTPMLYRNLLAMETEELLRSYPVDGAVLMGGCDKSTPALLMGAASRRPADRLRARRADAAGPLAQRGPRLRHRHVEVLGRQAGRADRRLRDGRAGERPRPLARATA